MQGPPVLLSYYVVRVISCGPVCHPSWVVCLVLQNLLGALWNTSGHTRCAVLLRDALFILASASAGRLGLFHAMSLHGSLSWSEGVVSFAFVTGFVAKTQAPPLLLGLQASLYWPNQRETIVMGDCYILCGRSDVTWSSLAAHRQRCERFPFAARCNRKSYQRPLSPSSSGCRCHGGADSRSRTVCFVSLELGALVLPLRLFFVKNFAVILARECDSCALPCEATGERPLLGSSQPSTGSVW